jgi:hypothetical protein
MVLFASGLLALSLSVAVRVVDCPELRVKLEGEIVRDVGVNAAMFSTVIVPYEYPLLAW